MGKSDWKDMREFLKFCEERGEVLRIKEEVDPEWEIKRRVSNLPGSRNVTRTLEPIFPIAWSPLLR